MVRYILFLVFSSVVVFTVTLTYRLGVYKDVTITEQERPQVALLYKAHLGAYHKINGVIREVEDWALTHNLPCKRTFGEYIDDPRTSDEVRMRSRGGCVLDGVQSFNLTEKAPEGFEVKILAAGRYLVAQFEGSPSISPFKVYPKVEEHLEKKGQQMSVPFFEIYTIRGNDEALTEYLFPTSAATK